MSDRAFALSMLALLLVVGMGAGLDLMEVDAAQYAGMSRDMFLRGEYLQLYFRGEDYLDKPPLLFWLSAASFKVFGVHDWSYRLPSILFAFLGLFSTYRFTRLYHSTNVARNAVLLFGGSAAFILMTNDVRCDTILTAAVITAIWLGCAWLVNGRTIELIGFSVAVGLGLLVKGPIGAVAPVIAVGGQLLYTRGWRKLIDLRLLLVPVTIGLLLLPMCIGLYEQFSVHGLRFYFWEQSFGRITGENRWVDDSTSLFFTHELPWQVLPWVLFVLIGTWSCMKDLITQRLSAEHASTIGAVLVFVALSLSHFKLPHYLYVTLPLFAVMGAKAIETVSSRWIVRFHFVLLGILWLLGMVLTVLVFPAGSGAFVLLLAVLLIVAFVFVRRRGLLASMVPLSYGLIMCIGVIMNGHFYPNLLQYQANAKAGQWVAEKRLPLDRFYGMQVSGSALDLYAGYPVRWISNVEEAERVIRPGVVIYTDRERRQELHEAGFHALRETLLSDYPVQLLDLYFLVPEQRHNAVRERYLLEF